MTTLLKSIDNGYFVQGHNPDTDGSETLWHVGGYYPWGTTGANYVVSLVSSSAEDDYTKTGPAGTGAYYVLLEGLHLTTINGVIGYQLQTEVVGLKGATPSTSTKTFSYLFRCRVILAGSSNANVGDITATINSVTVGVVPATENRMGAAIFVIPQFTQQGTIIHGAYLIETYAYLWAKTNATVMGSILMALPGTNIFSAIFRGSMTIDNPFTAKLGLSFMHPPGTKLELRVDDVSAPDQNIFGGFHMLFEV